MQKGMRTAGDLREFLLEMMQEVRSGKADLQEASTIAKLAAQVTASLTAEAQMALVSQKMGREFGSALLGAPDAESSAERIDDAGNGSGKITAISPPRAGAPTWCEQCEERVHPEKAELCKSPFCKAKAVAA